MKFIFEDKKSYLIYLLLLGLAYIPFFGHLDVLPIRMWDEARNAMNAYEMFKDGNWIVTHIDGQPEMWNTKPPLLIWCQVLFFKLIGLNEVSLRLPSAISGFLTFVAIVLTSIYVTKEKWLGIISGMVLITTHGYINLHVTRTGDYDAMLTFFTTSAALLIFFYTTQRQKILLVYASMMLMLAVLTKGVAGLMLLPSIFLFLLFKRTNFKDLIFNKFFVFSVLIFLVPILSFYLAREQINPGYLDAVRKNELGGRFLEVSEGHTAVWYYYIKNFQDFQFTFWYLYLIPGWIIGCFSKNQRLRDWAVFHFIMSIGFLLVITFSKTKLEWYDAPIYPFFAASVGIAIYSLFDFLKQNTYLKESMVINVFPIVMLILLFFKPYQKILDKTYKPTEYSWEEETYKMGYFLKEAIDGKYNLEGMHMFYDGYSYQNIFYLKCLQDKGFNVVSENWWPPTPNMKVFTCQESMKKHIDNYFIYSPIDTFSYGVVTYDLIALKPEFLNKW